MTNLRHSLYRFATSRIGRVASVLTCIVLVIGVWAWADAGDQYQAYSLRYKRVEEVQQQLTELLLNLNPRPRVVSDSRANQILISGSPVAHQIAQQYLQSVDRPALPPTPEGRGGPQAEVRGYACPKERLAELSERVQRQFASAPGVRITTDVASSQLVVLGPPEVHAAIAGLIAAPVTAGGNNAALLPPPPVPAQAWKPADQFVALAYLPPNELTGRLQRILGDRLQVTGQVPGAPAQLVYTDASSRQAELTVDNNRRGIRLVGADALVGQLARLITALDQQPRVAKTPGTSLRVLSIRRADKQKVRQAIDAFQTGQGSDAVGPAATDGSQFLGPSRGEIALTQFTTPVEPGPADQAPVAPEAGDAPSAIVDGVPADEAAAARLRQLGGEVTIDALPDLDVIILYGRDADVDEVADLIAEIERLSAETVPELHLYQLKHVNCRSLVTIISLVAQDLIGGRQGKVHVTPLVKPNALLLVGWGEAVGAMKELIWKLDQPTPADSQFRVYRLRHAPVATTAATIDQAFVDQDGLGPRIQIALDPRTNSLIVRGAPGDLKEVDLLIEKLDSGDSGIVNQARVFKLTNTLATELAVTLQSAIVAASGGAGDERSTILELLTADVQGRRILRSGVLSDVQITADPHTNSLVVSAPAESMDLLASLIEQLDSPTAVAQIKVFKVINGDANSLVEMLRTLLPAEIMLAGPQLAGAEGENTLAPVRFSVDSRTNSIIATGAQGDLSIIEALLLRLDQEDVEERSNTVYRLKNAPALDVANAINEFLRSERSVQMAAPGIVSPFEQIEREVVVVPELVSNSLIISATPRYFDQVVELVEQLDEQPAQVMIQVVIAEVELDNLDEFGVELGIQDSVLFDRSLLSDLETITTTLREPSAGGATTLTQQTVVAANNTPGFDFNNNPLGNAGSDRAFGNSGRVGAQGLSNFALGRVNSDLQYGGMILSASSDAVSVLIRALQESRRTEVLGRPQIMTLDNQSAFIQVGERVPRITGTRFDSRVQTNTIELENTGLILGVTPRISPDGMVVMEIDAEKSELGPEAKGVPVSVVEGSVIRSPTIEVTTAQTTVSAASGETIVLGGLISTADETVNRRVPVLGNIPILGDLFRYDFDQTTRSELLIFLTPHVVRSSEELDQIKQAEAAKMSWCLADVHALHGPTGIYEDHDSSCWGGEGEVVYPDVNPDGLQPGAFQPQEVPMENLELSPALDQLPTPAEGPMTPIVPAPAPPLPVPMTSNPEGGGSPPGVSPAAYHGPFRGQGGYIDPNAPPGAATGYSNQYVPR